ncbi:C-terminal binding protein [bacterium]|nr:C-terminal binding protein [bacterium]
MNEKVLVTDYAWDNLDIERSVLNEIGVDLVEALDGEEETLVGLAQGCVGILTCWAQTTEKVIAAALPDLQGVVRYGVGLDNIAIPFATRNGIPVAYVPDYCYIDVAEHVMALMLSIARKVTPFDRSIRSGSWSIQDRLPLNRLTERTLGLVGFGQIAQEVVPRARAFGMRVIAHSRSLTDERAGAVGAESVSLDVLLEESDFVSIHTPLTDETRGMIDEMALKRMKNTAFLINTSRGDVIDESALFSAVESSEIAGAALDVRTSEPPEEGDQLIHHENVIHTPHAAFYSAESLEELQRKAALEVKRVLAGEEPIQLVNPEYREAMTRER